MGFLTRTGPVVVMLSGLVACESGPKRANAIGEAYAGPATLKIRRDIPLESPVVATVKHGERLALLQKRRRFFKVRAPSGVEGWTDERQLLAKEDMDKLRELRARAAKMPPQGQATAFGELNVHPQPSRQSPSFLQIKENEKFEVLTHVATPRTDVSRKALLPPPKKEKSAVKKSPKEGRYPTLAPLPQPPGPRTLPQLLRQARAHFSRRGHAFRDRFAYREPRVQKGASHHGPGAEHVVSGDRP